MTRTVTVHQYKCDKCDTCYVSNIFYREPEVAPTFLALNRTDNVGCNCSHRPKDHSYIGHHPMEVDETYTA